MTLNIAIVGVGPDGFLSSQGIDSVAYSSLHQLV